MLIALVCLLGCVCTVLLAVQSVRARRSAQESIAKGPLVRAGAIAAAQLFLAVWAAMGLVNQMDYASIPGTLVANLLLCGCAKVCVDRPRVLARLEGTFGKKGTFPHPLIASVVLMLLAGLFAMLGLEISSNHDLTWTYPLCMVLEWGLITLAMLGLFFLFGRHSAPPAVVTVVMFILGIAEYFVILFKSMPIMPGDLTALSTAAAVAGTGYTYQLTYFCLLSLAFACISLVLCQFAAALTPARPKKNWRILVANVAVGLVCLGAIAAHVTFFDYYHQLYIQVYSWRPLESYYRQGFLPSFISGAQLIRPTKPEGYTVESAKALVKEYADAYDEDSQNGGASEARTAAEAQFDEDKPTVIAIMNETFSDLSIYQQLHADYEGPTYFNGLNDCLSRGRLYVSAYGGGTANSEFEFLTGNSMAYLGSGVYPYTTYDLTETENLAAQFKKLGYSTTAMHPNHATNWNRENVYQDFGFDQFLTIEDFQDSETLRGMVTDRATYDKILTMLDENSDPQFIFDVTMQNHSGYDTNLIPSDKLVNLQIDGVYNSTVNEYVSLIKQSDEALQYFIGRLRQLNRKVVVVFFGDHQPFFPSTFNDEWFTDEDQATHQERLWQTDYIIWANYDVAGNSQNSEVVDLSTNYLSSQLMSLIGAPMTDYQKAHMTLQKSLAAINSVGYEDAGGTWYLATSSNDTSSGTTLSAACEKARSDYQTMQYYEMFGDGKSIYTKHAQDAANETDPNLAPGTTKIK